MFSSQGAPDIIQAIRHAFTTTRAAGMTPEAIHNVIRHSYLSRPLEVTFPQMCATLQRMFIENGAILRGGIVFLQPN